MSFSIMAIVLSLLLSLCLCCLVSPGARLPRRVLRDRSIQMPDTMTISATCAIPHAVMIFGIRSNTYHSTREGTGIFLSAVKSANAMSAFTILFGDSNPKVPADSCCNAICCLAISTWEKTSDFL